MTDYQKVVSVIGGKEHYSVKHVDNEIQIVFNDFGLVFDDHGEYQYSYNFKE